MKLNIITIKMKQTYVLRKCVTLLRPSVPEIRGGGNGLPPDREHGVFGGVFVLEVVENGCYVRVAVVTAEIVHPLTVCLVSFEQRLVPVLRKGRIDGKFDGSDDLRSTSADGQKRDCLFG
jgi:hypothetical protein